MCADENSSKIISLLLGIIGSLLLLGGGLITYIFTRHVKDNDCMFKKNREDHREIFEILRDKEDKKDKKS